ncbi:MAG: hypothetical protein RJA44_558 [Pseudomonadota bacterium]|jgi:hypothetical protein
MTSNSDRSAAVASRVSFWLRHPALATMLLALTLLVAALAWPLLVSRPQNGGAAAQHHELPWQIEPQPQGGSRVFGLEPGRTSLREARERWGDDLQIAILTARGEAGALEAAVDNFRAGFVTGKLILSFETQPATLAQWRERALKREVIEGSTTLRERLHPDDLTAALPLPLVGLTFIPSVHLDADTVRQRFGEPAGRHALGAQQHWLYPERGLAVTLDPQGRELLQYVAPREFEARLMRPLLRAAAAAEEAASAAAAAAASEAAAASR